MRTCDWCMIDVDDQEYKDNDGKCFDCLSYSRENECSLCHNSRNTYLGGGKLCSSCYDKVVVNGGDVKLCDNYTTCGEKANVSMGLGDLCDKCRSKDSKPVKAVKSFISGVHRAFIKD